VKYIGRIEERDARPFSRITDFSFDGDGLEVAVREAISKLRATVPKVEMDQVSFVFYFTCDGSPIPAGSVDVRPEKKQKKQ
jgi:hypothetical protein